MSDHNDDSDNSSITSSSSRGSSPYVSDDDVIRCCETESDSLEEDSDEETKVPSWYISDKEKEEISDKVEDLSAVQIYPAVTRHKYPVICKRISDTVCDGWVFVAHSIMQLIRKGKDAKRLKAVELDVCCVSSTNPLRVITFINSSDADDMARVVRYNSQLARAIISHIEETTGHRLNVVHGVLENDCTAEAMTERVKAFGDTAKKMYFYKYLCMDSKRYQDVSHSLLNLLSSEGTMDVLENETENEKSKKCARLLDCEEEFQFPDLPSPPVGLSITKYGTHDDGGLPLKVNPEMKDTHDYLHQDIASLKRERERELDELKEKVKKQSETLEQIEREAERRVHEEKERKRERERELNELKEKVQKQSKTLEQIEREAERSVHEEKERKMRRLNDGRNIEWSEKYLEDLRTSILRQRRDSQGNPIVLRILLFGVTGHGKSSLCNGFRSALLGTSEVSTYHQTGVRHGSSFSRGMCSTPYGDNGYLCIIDMSGIYEPEAVRDTDVRDILSGKVPFDQEFTEHLQVLDRESMFIPEPGTNDVSCVVVVLKPDAELGLQTKRHLKIVDCLAKDSLISRRLVLTHIDQFDPKLLDPKNLPQFNKSRAIQIAVKTMSERTGIPPTAISVVRNYNNEIDTDMHSNILLLHTLNSIVSDACDSHERKIQQEMIKATYKGATSTAAKPWNE